MSTDGEEEQVAHIVRGTVLQGQSDHLATVRNHLCSSYPTSRAVKKEFESQLPVKEEQAAFLIDYCKSYGLFILQLPPGEMGLILEDMHDENV